MDANESQNRKFPPSTWIVLAALVLCLIAWFMQLYSLINWEGAIELGLQNDSFNGSREERTLAEVERSIAWADMIWPFPLTLIAITGLLLKRQSGFLAALLNFSICVYFPLVFSFHRWDTFRPTAILAIILFAIPSLIGITAIWLNRNIIFIKR